MSMLNKNSLLDLLPYGERMCLLDRVLSWDAQNIECETLSHQEPYNPLRDMNSLAAVCGLEYAAQAMAAHSALASCGHAPSRGFLGAVRALELRAQRLDTVKAALRVRAQRLLSEPAGAIYAFEIDTVEGPLLVKGRASVFLERSVAGGAR